MAQYIEFSKDVKVSGEVVLAFINGMGTFSSFALKILKSHGIELPHVGKWYPQSALLDSLQDIQKKGGKNTLRVIGQKILKNAIFPNEVNSIQDGLSVINEAYSMNHRGIEIGEYIYEKTGTKSGTLKCHNPYPCDFDRGIIDSMAIKTTSNNITVIIKHLPNSCRSKGDEFCTFSVKCES